MASMGSVENTNNSGGLKWKHKFNHKSVEQKTA